MVDAVSYNLLGRVTSSTRVLADAGIDGVGYTSSSTYDSLDRALTTTLPAPASAGVEVLTTTYNARGLFEGSSGIDDETSFVYVSSTDYIPAYAGIAAASISKRWTTGCETRSGEGSKGAKRERRIGGCHRVQGMLD